VPHDERHEEGELDVALEHVLKLLDDERGEQQADAKGDEPAGAAAREVEHRVAPFCNVLFLLESCAKR
jgi:hypothetical protein